MTSDHFDYPHVVNDVAVELLPSTFKHFGEHFNIVLFSSFFFFSIDFLSVPIGKHLFPAKFATFSKKEKREWRSRSVALVHAIICIPLCISGYNYPTLMNNRVFGYDPHVGDILAFSYGFVWDVYDAIFFQSAGLVVHGVACLAIFAFSFRPFLQSYGPTFLLWELSTPMLNLRWFFEKLGVTKNYPKINLANDLAFVIAFFVARIVFGSINSFTFFQSIIAEREKIPLWLFSTYGAGNVALNSLNWLWFSKIARRMISTLQGKPRPKRTVKTNGIPANGTQKPVKVVKDDVKDEPLVEAIDQYDEYGQPTTKVGKLDLKPIGTGCRSATIARQGGNRADPDSPSPVLTVRQAFLIALGFRSISLLSQTFFQPDEFYQAYEPAHWLVFGTGHLTWEWRVLPAVSEHVIQSLLEQGGWRAWMIKTIGTGAGGRLRGWLWPGIFAAVYKGLKLTGLDETRLIVVAPRLPTVIFAAITDLYTFRLADKILPGRAEAALFLSLTNLFHAHALPRALTTSAETCLTVVALFYWPFESGAASQDKKKRRIEHVSYRNLILSLSLSATAFILRPTNVIFWAVLGLDLIRHVGQRSVSKATTVALMAIVTGTTVMCASSALDWLLTGKFNVPGISFFIYNILYNISENYGTSPWHYHLSQSIPILTTTALPFLLRSFFAALTHRDIPRTLSDSRQSAIALQSQDRILQVLALAVTTTTIVYSGIAHKEWRFLHPMLPILLLFASNGLVSDYLADPEGGLQSSKFKTFYSGLRISRRKCLFLSITPMIPWFYLNFRHGRGQVAVTEWLGNQARSNPGIQARFLMPCHATPWMSHIHLTEREQADKWQFLTCEPPIGENKATATEFYQNPSHVVDDILRDQDTTHLVMFGDLLSEKSESRNGCIKEKLKAENWVEVWRSHINGLDLLQDESERRGGIRVFHRTQVE